MSNSFESQTSWDRLAAELRACKEAQKQAYGDVDSATLGRYLAGEMTPAEAATLEETLAELPELRKLTDIVQDVLRDLEPISEVPTLSPSLTEAPIAPVILPIQSARPRRRPSRLRHYAPLAAAACLFLAIGVLMPRATFKSSSRTASLVAGSGVAMRTTGLEDRMVFLTLEHAQADPTRGGGEIQPLALPRQPAPIAPVADDKRDNPYTSPRTGQAALPSGEALNQAVVGYYHRGEVDQAAKALRQAHLACKKHLGDRHKATQWTARQLAGVLQFALNEKQEAVAPLALAGDSPRTRALNSARTLREQIVSRPTTEVRQNVVPLLTDALAKASKSEERLALTRALGELGPAARPAVPLLCDRLKRTRDPRERLTILQTLDQMGPAASEAVPTLTALVARGGAKEKGKLLSPPSFKGDKGSRFAPSSVAKLPRNEVDLAQAVLHRLTGREARVGVFDSAGLFCLNDTINATRALRKLARESEVEIRIDSQADRKPIKSMLPQMGSLALHIILSEDGKQVQVNASKALREQGMREKDLAGSLSECACKGEGDAVLKTLLDAVKRLKPTDGKQ